MHLIFYGQSSLELKSLSSGISWLIIIGAFYGIMRLGVDVLRLLWRLRALRKVRIHMEPGHLAGEE